MSAKGIERTANLLHTASPGPVNVPKKALHQNVGHPDAAKFCRDILEAGGLGRRQRDVRSVAYNRHPLVDRDGVF